MLDCSKKYAKNVQKICEPLFDMFAVTFFSHTRAYHNGSFLSLITNPEFTEYYLEQKYPIAFSNGVGYFLESGIYIGKFLQKAFSNQINLEVQRLFNMDHFVYIFDVHICNHT